MQRNTVARIDLEAIQANVALAASLAPTAEVVAVIKADAYGHGIVPVAEALRDRVPMFGVATVDEGLTLREAGIDNAVLVLEGATTRAASEAAIAKDLVLMVHAEDQVAMLKDMNAPVWLKVDTGMRRLGIDPADLGSLLKQLQSSGADVQAVCTHLACADEMDSDATRQQLEIFRIATAGYDGPLSIANSAGIIAWPDSHADWIRPGIMLYGASPFSSDIGRELTLHPAMTLSARIIAIREIQAGESVGYGARWTASRPSVIATIATGYADGYPRHAPNGTPVFLGGAIVPLVGTVSMDMITVDLTDHVGAAVGDTAELWGQNVSVNDVATLAGTIGYELLAGVTPRVPRLYG
jgi:alanine racemase